MELRDYLTDGTFSSGDSIAIYSDGKDEVEIFKRGSKYYGDAGSFDFEAKNLKELKKKLRDWGYTKNYAGKDLKI